MRGCGLFLILLGLVIMFGVGLGASANASIRQALAPIFCSAEEQFVTDSQVENVPNQTRFYCQGDDKQYRNVTRQVLVTLTTLGVVPILVGLLLMIRFAPSNEQTPHFIQFPKSTSQAKVFTQYVIIKDGKQHVFTSDGTNNQTFTETMDRVDMGISFDGKTFKMPGIEIRLDEIPSMENMDNKETIRQDTLRQLQEAWQAGLISEEEFERFRQNLDTI